ncbi:MAG: peptidase T [Hungatella sp.]|nr:peptidase T [Hungatella sp.]
MTESSVKERFLRYVKIDTQSQPDVEAMPSTQKQFHLAKLLAEELNAMGAENVKVDEHAYVCASIPATTEKKVPVLGFIAHMDTSPACSGEGVSPVIIKDYDGGDIVMNRDTGLTMRVADYPELLKYKGWELITTDGNTLLGADDKAGVAEIMALAEYLLSHPEIPHGAIKIGFTPDEEVGNGAKLFDVKGFGADVAYTVDGGCLGELEYENFNAASALVTIHGFSIHTGAAKNRMKNAILMGMEFHQMLPVFENPGCTEGYEGFFHLNDMEGSVEKASLNYIIRDHDMEKFKDKKACMQHVADYLNRKYGEGTFELKLKDSYYNMKEKIKEHFYLIDIATQAMKDVDVEPLVSPIRGGTDGARLSFMGLPCPNLCTGGHNYHGRYEFIPVQSMEKTVEILYHIVKRFEEREWIDKI